MGFLEGTDREKDRIVGGRKKRAALGAFGRPRRRRSLPSFPSAVMKNLWIENNLLPVKLPLLTVMLSPPTAQPATLLAQHRRLHSKETQDFILTLNLFDDETSGPG